MSPTRSTDAGDRLAWIADVLVEYERWLDRQRGLAPVTVSNYSKSVAQFLRTTLTQPAEVSVSLLDAGIVTAFMVEFCSDRNTNSAKSMARSVRSFLRFAHATGRTSADLSGAVPVPAGWHLASLPKAVPAADLQHLLGVASRHCGTATDRRDYAILLLLARLGLRRGEIAALGLDDIDWRAGELTIVGKGSHVERLPLPSEPGEAIAAWLVDGRPACATRSVFTTVKPAGRPISTAVIAHLVAAACRDAGLERINAHRFRHTLATQMLRSGASLPEVSQVLRHRSVRSTAIYAKVDDVALRPLARPWPTITATTDSDAGPGMARPWPGARS